MLGRTWLLLALLGMGGAVQAQRLPGPAYFLRHPGGTQGPPPLPAILPEPPFAPGPVVGAVRPSPPVARPAELPTAGEPAPRRDLTGPRGFPVYDPYQNLPEAYRKHTLPDARLEPLPVQLLRGLLGQ